MKAVMVEIRITPVNDDETKKRIKGKVVHNINDYFPTGGDLKRMRQLFIMEQKTLIKHFYCCPKW